MKKIIILGSGAAPGVPSVCDGYGLCNPNNLKNYRSRTTTYIDYNGTRIMIDTSPDLRTQMLKTGIRELDAVLYTHAHADHLHGIDDLREVNRVMRKSLNIYASAKTMKVIKKRFDYLLSGDNNCFIKASLIANVVKDNESFYIDGIKIVAVPLLKHIEPSVGYVFNDGEIVYLADCKGVDKNLFNAISKKVKLLILPLTNIEEHPYHLGLDDVKKIITQINPVQVVINHMSTCCDYDKVSQLTDDNVFPAFDGMKVEFV